MITIQTVAMAIAITAHPTVTVVKIATSGTSESPEFDHFDPENRIGKITNYQFHTNLNISWNL